MIFQTSCSSLVYSAASPSPRYNAVPTPTPNAGSTHPCFLPNFFAAPDFLKAAIPFLLFSPLVASCIPLAVQAPPKGIKAASPTAVP